MAYTSKIQSLREWKKLSSCKISDEINSSHKPLKNPEIRVSKRKLYPVEKIFTRLQEYIKEKLFFHGEQFISRMQAGHLVRTTGFCNETIMENAALMKLPELLLRNNLLRFFRKEDGRREVNGARVTTNNIENAAFDLQEMTIKPLPLKEDKYPSRVLYFFHFNLYKVLKVNSLKTIFQESIKIGHLAFKSGNFMKNYIYRFLDILYEMMEKLADRTSSSFDKQAYRADIL